MGTMAKMSSPETPAKTPTTHLVYADGHDAFDDAAWYINGELVGRQSQTHFTTDILARISATYITYEEIKIPEETDELEFLNWPATLEELRSLLAELGA